MTGPQPGLPLPASGPQRWANGDAAAAAVATAVVASLGAGGDDGSLRDAVARWAADLPPARQPVRELAELRDLLLRERPARRTAVIRTVDAAMTYAAEAVAARLVHAALTDPLTGLLSRRSFDTALRAAVAAASRADRPLSLVIADLDGLKQINDREGHPAGDAVLVRLATTLGDCLRESDGAYRLGGDEFALLLPDTPAEAAAAVVTRVLDRGAPSFSWGVAECPRDTADALELVRLADTRMYERRRSARSGAPEPAPTATGRPPVGGTARPVERVAPESRRREPVAAVAPGAVPRRRRLVAAGALAAVLLVAGLAVLLSSLGAPAGHGTRVLGERGVRGAHGVGHGGSVRAAGPRPAHAGPTAVVAAQAVPGGAIGGGPAPQRPSRAPTPRRTGAPAPRPTASPSPGLVDGTVREVAQLANDLVCALLCPTSG